jgi:hypothetical protein
VGNLNIFMEGIMKVKLVNEKDEYLGTIFGSAEFICKAVNNHEKLVELVKTATSLLSNTGKDTIGEVFYKNAKQTLKEIDNE